MDPYILPFNIRDGFLIVAYLLGAGIGVAAIARNEKKTGGYVLTGFLLLLIDPMTELIIYNFLTVNFGEGLGYDTFNWAYACISALVQIGGISTLLAAVYFAVESKRRIANNEIIYTDKN